MQAAFHTFLTYLLTASAGSGELSLNTPRLVSKSCGEDAILPCSVTKSVNVIQYIWKDENTICDYYNTVVSIHSPGVHCNYTVNQSFVLTVKNVKPKDNRTYTCQLLTTSGHSEKKTILHVHDCEKSMTTPPSEKLMQQTRNGSCTTDSGWIRFLVSLTVMSTLLLNSGM